MARIFFNMIIAHKITIEDVPDTYGWQEQTQELLDQANTSNRITVEEDE